MTPEFSKLHQKASLLAEGYRRHEALLLEVLVEIDRKKAYLPLGYPSLFQYCLNALKLTEAQSYAFMAVSRKSLEVPELKEMVQKNEMTLSNARRIVSVITPENKEAWLEKGKVLTQANLEREIAKENAEPPVRERLRPVSENELELKVGLSPEMEANLKRVKALLGTESTKEALECLLKDYLKRHDPVKKAERNMAKRSSKTVPALGVSKVARPNNRYVPRPILHEVHQRDRGLCQFKGQDGKRCLSSYWVQVHHLEPFAFGGKHEVNNLLTLCQRHHQHWHHR